MDKSCNSSGDSTSTNTVPSSNNNKDQYLIHLNKISHKIAKPPIRKPTFEPHQIHPIPPPHPQQDLQQQNQPPVYNINKSDFREVVQKLTGSPAHDRFTTPPPIHPPKPQSSRLQRIRPPPLAQLSHRPPPLLNNAVPPLSPLPPFPAVHAAAESPISAYMRYLQNSTANLSPLAPRWNSFTEPQQNMGLPSPTSASMGHLQFPATSPLGFGCMPSPKSPYPSLFSQFPLSPTLPVPSPTWKGH